MRFYYVVKKNILGLSKIHKR